jgi:hypothetical protein
VKEGVGASTTSALAMEMGKPYPFKNGSSVHIRLSPASHKNHARHEWMLAIVRNAIITVHAAAALGGTRSAYPQ